MNGSREMRRRRHQIMRDRVRRAQKHEVLWVLFMGAINGVGWIPSKGHVGYALTLRRDRFSAGLPRPTFAEAVEDMRAAEREIRERLSS